MAAATEYTSVAQEIYISYFGRPADRAGLAEMTRQLANANAPTTTAGLDAAYNTNTTVRALIDSFGSSAESTALYGSSTTDAFVTAIYQNLFNRGPDMAGLNFWAGAIESGALTRAAAAHSILSGALTANGADAAIITNKVAVASNFTAAIDTYQETNAYAGDAAAAVARALLANVSGTTTAAEYQGQVTTTLANLVNSVQNGQTVALTIGVDAITGTSGNDTFVARIFDNSNSLQSGDVINGGAGTDVLTADIGNSQRFALTAETTGIETVQIRAQAVSTDSTDNNTSKTNEVQIDAERMHDVTRWESNNSRADLLIEDVRINANQVTKDITVAFVSSDPGNVDFGVYFDQHSLKSVPTVSTGAVLRLQLMDTRSNDLSNGADPLEDNVYNGFVFLLDGKAIKVGSTAIYEAKTYDALFAAVKAAVAATKGLENFEVTANTKFNAFDTETGELQVGTEITLTNRGAGVITTGTGSMWVTEGGVVPPSSGLHANMVPAAAVPEEFKITSTIILDDVGRGSMGGDLVVGGLSVGDTSLSTGVERFEITVERSSKLQTINSTNNTLQEISIVNGVANPKGNLTVTGTLPGGQNNSGGSNIDAALPGVQTVNGGDQHTQYGFSDVREIDASAFTGNLTFDSVITDRSIAKYMSLVDVNASATLDNINFEYTGGTGNDTISVDIDSGVLASRSHIVSGLADFTLAVDGGAGDDTISVRLVNPANTGNNQNWYNNQDLNNNITIDGGAGNDTIRKLGAGDTRINGGEGNDTIYSENTGAQRAVVYVNTATSPATGATNPIKVLAESDVNGTWVFNTTDQFTAGANARNLNDLRSDTNEPHRLYNTKLTVTFKGIVTTIDAAALTIGSSTTGVSTDLEINQAIKHAINSDAVLSKLLYAADGPANSLVVTSLIDGDMTTADLHINFIAPTALTAADVTALGSAYSNTALTAADLLALFQANVAGLNSALTSDYATALANAGAGVDLTGANSIATSDNIINPGSGNDVVVLGTAAGDTFATSSNEVVVFGPAFGNDVVVNFAATGSGIDHLDFTSIGGTLTAGAGFNGLVSAAINKSINVVLADVTNTATTASTAETKIAALYTDSATAATHVYVTVDGGNIGTVYQVTDAALTGAGSIVVTKAGTIDLADTSWFDLTASSFVNSNATGYFLVEGANGAVGGGTGPVVLPIPLPANSTAPVTATAAAEQFSFTVATAQASAANTQIALSGFDVVHDSLKIDTLTLGATTLAELNGVDGIVVQADDFTYGVASTLVTFGADANGDLIVIALVGVTDPAVVNVTVV